MLTIIRSLGLTISTFALAVSAFAQQSPPATQPNAPPDRAAKLDRIAEITANILDKTHGGATWRGHSALACDIALKIGDRHIDGRLTLAINGSSARLDLKDGIQVMFDGANTWISSAAGSEHDRSAAALPALRELMTVPFVVQDRTKRLTDYRSMYVVGRDTDSFVVNDRVAEGAAGRPPARVYVDAQSHQLAVIGIADLAQRLGFAAASPAPRAVVFSDARGIDGVTLPMTWTFYDWTEATGVRGDGLGSATLSNCEFLKADDARFAPLEQSRKVDVAADSSAPRAPGR